ncbi:MAG: DUF2845 domain-containing protein [Rhodanobacter sp.]|jgi:hypothetical protein|nr:DUF2845 domain-containing protein [Rhodanobacter sp.]
MLRYLLPLLLLIFATPDAFAMRCGSRIIGEGAQDFQVRDRCGHPFWTDSYTGIEIIGTHGPVEQQRSVQYDIWYYNFGPSQLMRRLVFADGVLLREETLGYGVDVIGNECNPNRIFDGFTAGELFARCGAPVSRRQMTDALVRRPLRGVELWRDQRREDWVYDFGDRRFLRVVHIVDGRVTGAELVQR